MSQEALWRSLGRMLVDEEFQRALKAGADENIKALVPGLEPDDALRLANESHRYFGLVEVLSTTRGMTRQWQEQQIAEVDRVQKELREYQRETHARLRSSVARARAAALVSLVAGVVLVLTALGLLAAAAVLAWTTREAVLPAVLGGLGLAVLLLNALMHPVRNALRALRHVARTEMVTLALIEQGVWWGAAFQVHQIPIELASQQFHARALDLLRALSGDVPEPPPRPDCPERFGPAHPDGPAGRAHGGSAFGGGPGRRDERPSAGPPDRCPGSAPFGESATASSDRTDHPSGNRPPDAGPLPSVPR